MIQCLGFVLESERVTMTSIDPAFELYALPPYEAIATALACANTSTSPAEAHGLLCGFISAGTQIDGKSWVEPVLGLSELKHPIDEDNKRILLDLYDVTCHQLKEGLEFQILLPDDDSAKLNERAESLGAWCQGYIAGLNLAGIDTEEQDNEDLQEILYDLMDIAQINGPTEATEEEDEIAYTELTEYTKVAVLTVFLELNTPDSADLAGQRLH